MKLFAIWIFKPVMVVFWLIHLDAAYAQGRRCSMGYNPTVDRRQHPLMNAACRVEATCLVKVKRRREHRRKLTLSNFPRNLTASWRKW